MNGMRQKFYGCLSGWCPDYLKACRRRLLTGICPKRPACEISHAQGRVESAKTDGRCSGDGINRFLSLRSRACSAATLGREVAVHDGPRAHRGFVSIGENNEVRGCQHFFTMRIRTLHRWPRPQPSCALFHRRELMHKVSHRNCG